MPGRGLALLRAPVKPLMVIVGVLLSVLVPAVVFPTLAVDPAPPPLNPPLVGFSFSPASLTNGSDPDLALAELLRTLQPDLVRLPVYWSTVAPTATTLDYTEVDGLIKTVQAHNAQRARAAPTSSWSSAPATWSIQRFICRPGSTQKTSTSS